MIDWLIRKLGGYTHAEYKELYDKYHKALYETIDERAIQLCNETTRQNLMILEKHMRTNYAIDWRDEVFNVVHNNLMRVIIYHLGDASKHIIYKLNPTLTSKEKLIENIQNS